MNMRVKMNIREYIDEINRNYNDLGDDLLMLEAVALASEREAGFPGECVVSSMDRLEDYIRQHIGEIHNLTQYLTDACAAGCC